jgi:hypothetical protein
LQSKGQGEQEDACKKSVAFFTASFLKKSRGDVVRGLEEKKKCFLLFFYRFLFLNYDFLDKSK